MAASEAARIHLWKNIWIGVVLGVLVSAVFCGSSLLVFLGNAQLAARLYPNNAFARVSFSDDLYKKGKYQAAITQCQIALQYAPRYLDAHMGLGLSYFNLRQYAAAEEQFAIAAQLAPQATFTHVRLGESLYMMGQYKNAIPEFSRAVQLNPDDAIARDWLRKATNKERLEKTKSRQDGPARLTASRIIPSMTRRAAHQAA